MLQASGPFSLGPAARAVQRSGASSYSSHGYTSYIKTEGMVKTDTKIDVDGGYETGLWDPVAYISDVKQQRYSRKEKVAIKKEHTGSF